MNEAEFKEKNQININLTYPRSDEFDFLTKIEVIDLDQEAKNDIESKTKIFDQIYELVRERCEIKYR